MRAILLFIAAISLAPMGANAQSPKDIKSLFDTVQKLGTDTALRGDIAGRLGFGEDDLAIKDLVVTANGKQHALNAFVVADKSYVLFHTRAYLPEIYIFVEGIDGALVAGIHGRQYEPIDNTSNMSQHDAAVVDAEEAFWFQWLADGAKVPAN